MGEEALYVRGIAGSRDERTDDRRREQGAVVVQKGQRAHEIELPVGDPEHLGQFVAGELAEREHAGRDAQALERTGDERSEEHTSELQSRLHLVCRLLLEKKK